MIHVKDSRVADADITKKDLERTQQKLVELRAEAEE